MNEIQHSKIMLSVALYECVPLEYLKGISISTAFLACSQQWSRRSFHSREGRTEYICLMIPRAGCFNKGSSNSLIRKPRPSLIMKKKI